MVDSTAEHCNSALSSLICATRLSSRPVSSAQIHRSRVISSPSGPGRFRHLKVCVLNPSAAVVLRPNSCLLLFIIYFHAQRKQTSSKGVFHWRQNPEISNSQRKQNVCDAKKEISLSLKMKKIVQKLLLKAAIQLKLTLSLFIRFELTSFLCKTVAVNVVVIPKSSREGMREYKVCKKLNI